MTPDNPVLNEEEAAKIKSKAVPKEPKVEPDVATEKKDATAPEGTKATSEEKVTKEPGFFSKVKAWRPGPKTSTALKVTAGVAAGVGASALWAKFNQD